MTRSALILGTLAGQADAMRVLQARGWRVHACGHLRQGPGVEAADEFHLVDFLDVDATAELVTDLDVDVLYSVGSDIAMPTIAAVSERLGLPCFYDIETTEILHRKDRLREFLASAGLSVIQHRTVTDVADLDDFDRFPAIMKPTDSQGQRGITIVDNHAAAAAALPHALQASRTGRAVIEEWLDGPEISIHVLVVDGEVQFFLPSDRYVWDGPLVGIPEGHAVPSAFLTETDRPEVMELVNAFVTALGVTTGPLYFQLKLTSHGPRIIEVAPRLDGCHLWRLVEIHTGLNLIQACFDLLTGGEWTEPPRRAGASKHTLHFYLGPPDQPFRAADQEPMTTGRVLFNEYQVREGELPRDTNGVVSRLGYWIEEQPA